MSRTPQNIRQQLITIMKRFKFQELESTVLSQFPETSWDEIRSTLVQHHDSFTASNVIKMIEQTIRDEKIDEHDLRDRVAQLQFIEISRHHKQRHWFGYQLKGENNCSLLQTKAQLFNSFIHCHSPNEGCNIPHCLRAVFNIGLRIANKLKEFVLRINWINKFSSFYGKLKSITAGLRSSVGA